jgi:ribosomal-protein-serine acetyltransferase
MISFIPASNSCPNQKNIVGVCSIEAVNSNNRSANIGYWISENHSGRSIARTVTKRLVEYGFDNLNLHRIEIRAATMNWASQKVAESCGFQFEGIAKDCEWLYDHFVDLKVYALINKKN